MTIYARERDRNKFDALLLREEDVDDDSYYDDEPLLGDWKTDYFRDDYAFTEDATVHILLSNKRGKIGREIRLKVELESIDLDSFLEDDEDTSGETIVQVNQEEPGPVESKISETTEAATRELTSREKWIAGLLIILPIDIAANVIASLVFQWTLAQDFLLYFLSNIVAVVLGFLLSWWLYPRVDSIKSLFR